MKKKQLKYRIQSIQPSKEQLPSIAIVFEDNYFVRSIRNGEGNGIVYPELVLKRCTVQYLQRQIIFRNKQSRFEQQSQIQQKIHKIFEGLISVHIKYNGIDQQQQILGNKLKNKGYDILSVKKFHIAEGRFQKGDFLVYVRGNGKDISSSTSVTYIQNQNLLFQVDSLFNTHNIPVKYTKSVMEVILKESSEVMKNAANEIDLVIVDMIGNQSIKEGRSKRPGSAIKMIVSGNSMNIHQLYEIIEEKLSQMYLQVVEVDQRDLVLDVGMSLWEIFPEFKSKVYKLSSTAILILDRQLSGEQVKRKLKLKLWIIGPQNLSRQQIQILQSQNKKGNLKKYMTDKKIVYENIEIRQNLIKITSDELTKTRFIQQSKAILKTFIKQRQICRNFDNYLYIQIFKKYYQEYFQNQFHIEFQINSNYIIRNNFTKYSDEIQQQFKCVRDKIKNKLITFVSINPINQSSQTHKLYYQKQCYQGYSHELLGCKLFMMGHVKIKMKPLESLKRQEQCMAYILDDRLENQSIFYSIIENNKLNYSFFLKDAHRAKKPDRLRQYITEDCPYAHKTVLLHAGREKVTQTLRRDLQGLFSLQERRVCIALLKHEQDFYKDVFKIVLQQIELLGNSIYQNGINPNFSSEYTNNNTKNNFQADFYYEGGIKYLQIIQYVMGKMRNPQILQISSFGLEDIDIQKIYALEYYQMEIKYGNQIVVLSPIIAQLYSYEIFRRSGKKKFIFSVIIHSQHQLVQLIISTKSNIFYKITHDGCKPGWSKYPHIQKLQELDDEVKKIVQTIKKYCAKTNYIVISGESISDGVHGRNIKYGKEYFMGKTDQQVLDAICINQEIGKIFQGNENNKVEFSIKKNNIQCCYEITTYKEELPNVNALINE